MGLSFSCPGGDANLDERLEALFMRSLSFSGDYVKSTLRSVSYNGRDSEPVLLKAFGSGKLILEGALSFNRREMDPFHLETTISLENPSAEKENPNKTRKRTRFGPLNERAIEVPVSEPGSPKHEAAVKLQKVYKSFRTRRQLADCAVLVEQRWWKLLDFALLRRSSVSFFDIEKPESAVSKWSRAKSRAAKVGKGLSKNEKARKLALQHWLEAIDPRHRYGHNLHFYYDSWLRCESRQPFFYWLDVGDGKEVSLEQNCPRSKLQQQCIKYLGPKEREAYEVVIEEGKFLYKKTRQVLDTTGSSTDTKWIFVLSASKNLYVGQKRKGTFQHSSFLAGGATSAAGRLEVENGILKAVWPHSGHYRPTEENFQEFVSFLKEHNVDLTDVKESPSEEEEESWTRLRGSRSELDLSKTRTWETDKQDASEPVTGKVAILRRSISFDASTIKSPSCASAGHKLEGDQLKEVGAKIILGDQESEEEEDEEEEEEELEEEGVGADEKANSHQESNEVVEDSSSMTKGHYMFCKPNLFVEDQEEDEEAFVPSELILRRISSKKGMKSYQLGQQLSFKWTTGAGPRIGCVRDYPSELQFRALEQVNLSPRSAGASRFAASPRNLPSPGPRTPEASPLKDAQPDRPNADR